MSETIFNVNLDDFDEKVLRASQHKPVLVDLWAEWCAPCRVIAPILQQALQEYDGEVLLAKIEVDEDENMKLAGRYKVRGFPTIILFQNGDERGRFSGAKSLAFILNFIDEHTDL